MSLLQIPKPTGHRRITSSARTMAAVSTSGHGESVLFVSDDANASLKLAPVTALSGLPNYVRDWQSPGTTVIAVYVQYDGRVNPTDIRVPGSDEDCSIAIDAIEHLFHNMKDTRARSALRAMYRHLNEEGHS